MTGKGFWPVLERGKVALRRFRVILETILIPFMVAEFSIQRDLLKPSWALLYRCAHADDIPSRAPMPPGLISA